MDHSRADPRTLGGDVTREMLILLTTIRIIVDSASFGKSRDCSDFIFKENLSSLTAETVVVAFINPFVSHKPIKLSSCFA